MTLPPARIATLTVTRGLAWGCIVTRVDANDDDLAFPEGTTARMVWQRRDGAGDPVTITAAVSGAVASFALDAAATLALDADTLVGYASYAPGGDESQRAPLGAFVVPVTEPGDTPSASSQTVRVSAATQSIRLASPGGTEEAMVAAALQAAAAVSEMHAEIAGHFDDMLYLLGQTDYTATLTVGADVLASESVTPEGYPAVTLTLP